nr:MAG TPA: hypothetical protein [Caudoviricetes sp.]
MLFLFSKVAYFLVFSLKYPFLLIIIGNFFTLEGGYEHK